MLQHQNYAISFFYLPTFNTPCMGHLLYLMFRCNFDVMENLESLGEVNTVLVLAIGLAAVPLVFNRESSERQTLDLCVCIYIYI